MTVSRSLPLRCALLFGLAFGCGGSGLAQPAPAPSGQATPPANPDARSEPARPAQRDGRRLPPDVSSEHEVALPGRTLRFRATAGSLPLVDPGGAVQAEIAVVSYRLLGAGEPGARPVTFVVNGGPGAASAYLHLMLAGPWRLAGDLRSPRPSAPPTLEPNADTWLDFTDLVFIDPVGTGYSRANGSEAEIRERYFDLDGDIASLSAVIARWLRENDRLLSPKFFLGESYGGFRGPLIARGLATETGIGLSGIVLVSPVLDFGLISEPRWSPLGFVGTLPGMAATALERARGSAGPPVGRGDLAAAEDYASGQYLQDLLRGPNDAAALGRITARVSTLTGLDPELVRRRGGRIDTDTFRREVGRDAGRIASAYDGGASSLDPDPTAPDIEGADAGLAPYTAPLTSAAVDLLWNRLGWRVPNARYALLNGAIAGQWRYGRRGRRAAQSFTALRDSVALDPAFRVLVAHGLTDLVTPYFADELLLRQLPVREGARRVNLSVFPGGHMFYTRPDSRTAFRDAARTFYADALREREEPGR